MRSERYDQEMCISMHILRIVFSMCHAFGREMYSSTTLVQNSAHISFPSTHSCRLGGTSVSMPHMLPGANVARALEARPRFLASELSKKRG